MSRDQLPPAERDDPPIERPIDPPIERHGSGPVKLPLGSEIIHGPAPRAMRPNASSICRR